MDMEDLSDRGSAANGGGIMDRKAANLSGASLPRKRMFGSKKTGSKSHPLVVQ
jgi:hypothetical protein